MMMPLLSKRKQSREEVELEIKSRNSTNLAFFCILIIIIIFSAFVNPWLQKLRTGRDQHFFNFRNDTNKTFLND